MAFEGFVLQAANLGLQSIFIKPKRGIYNPLLPDRTLLPDILADAVLEERHVDQLEITEHPVEQGAFISDHAYKLPAVVQLTLGWSNSKTDTSLLSAAVGTAAATSSVGQVIGGVLGAASALQSFVTGASVDQIQAAYNSLLALQEFRALFDLYTGKRIYQNMLCKLIATETNSSLENILVVTMECQQVIMVNTQLVSLPKAAQKFPGQTSSTAQKGLKFMQQVQ